MNPYILLIGQFLMLIMGIVISLVGGDGNPFLAASMVLSVLSLSILLDNEPNRSN